MAYYDAGSPVLAQGVASELASGQPKAVTLDSQRGAAEFLRDRRADQNALDRQGYGVVVKAGEWDRYRDLLGELLRHREQQAGPVTVFEVQPSGITTVGDARSWMSQEYLNLPEEKQPAYILIAGDLEEVPLALQRTLSAEAHVGRLAFTNPETTRDDRNYGEYARKVVAWETHPADRPNARVLFYAVDDGTRAVTAGYEALVARGKPQIEC